MRSSLWHGPDLREIDRQSLPSRAIDSHSAHRVQLALKLPNPALESRNLFFEILHLSDGKGKKSPVSYEPQASGGREGARQGSAYLMEDIRRLVSFVNWHLTPRDLHSLHDAVSVASHYLAVRPHEVKTRKTRRKNRVSGTNANLDFPFPTCIA